jgi:hypothetical protein
MKIFEKSGPVNTDAVVKIAASAAARADCIVVASITGSSALKVAEKIKDKQVVCVTCPQGMYWQVNEMKEDLFAEIPELRAKRDEWSKQGLEKVPMYLTPENKTKLEQLGVQVVRGTIPLFGPSFSMRQHLQKTTSLDVMAKTLELISTGTLVCMETVLMATDAGIIPHQKRVLACAGTEMGLDTAWITRNCPSAQLFHPTEGFRFVECLAKPEFPQIPRINAKYLAKTELSHPTNASRMHADSFTNLLAILCRTYRGVYLSPNFKQTKCGRLRITNRGVTSKL